MATQVINTRTAELLNNLYEKSNFIEEKEAIVQEKYELHHLLKNPNRFDEEVIENRLASLSKELKGLKESRHNINMLKGRFVRILENFMPANLDKAPECDAALAIVVKHGYKYNVPNFVYFYKKGEEDINLFSELDNLLQKMSAEFAEAKAIEKKQEGLVLTRDEFMNDWVKTGRFYVDEADEYLKHLDECFEKNVLPTMVMPYEGIAIYTGDDRNATANL